MNNYHVFMADRAYFVAALTENEAATKALKLYMLVNDELPNSIRVIDPVEA